MKKTIHIILGLLFMTMEAAAGDTVSIHTDFIYISGKKIGQDVFYTLSADAKMSVKLECYRYVPGQDSVLMARTLAPGRKFRKGTGRMQLLYNGSEYKGYLQPSFGQTLKQTGIIPPGSYKVFVSVGNDRIKAERTFLREIDSLLPPQSLLRTDMHNLLLSGSKNISQRKRDQSSSDHADRVFRRSRRQMERHFRRKGINMVYRSQEGKEIADLYYGGWFLGRYEMEGKTSVSSQISKEQRDLSSVSGSVTGNELGNYQSLFSQFRELKKGRKENEEMEGELSWSSVAGNDQEAYSQTENTYHELRGQVMMPVLGLPVSFEGFYTTQDRHREAKAGYLRMRYDASRSKEKLLQLINGYKQQYANTDARGGSYRMIYGQFIVQARAQQATAIDRLKRESGITMQDGSAPDLDMLKKRAEEQALDGQDKLQDSSDYKGADAGAAVKKNKEKSDAAKQEAEARYHRWEEQYNNIRSLEEKISHYQALLDQYQHTLHYDSLLAYDKVKELDHADEMSYKDLSKKAGSILPEGKSGKFLTGITTIDLGMFPKYLSDYTLSGQRMTGADMGYDAGIAEIGAGYGKMEYINRDGSVEGYAGYNGRVMFKPLMKQKLGLIYYGYSPGRRLLTEGNFFKGTEVSLPSFRKPVHIVSAVYSGELSKYAVLTGEYAISRHQGETLRESAQQKGGIDQSAYNFSLAGSIPQTAVTLEAGYEHTGNAFENNTLPVVMAGTDRYRAAGKGDFFRSFLTLGIEYNYLQQKSFHYRGGNSRWGFEVQTHSRRYPSLFLSYKPFATFRSYDDTLSIAQKPMLGAVWTGRLNYQVKRQDRAIRFVLLYSRNSSINDTVRYGSTLLQLTTIYTAGRQNITLNAGSTHVLTNLIEAAYPALNDSRFVSLSAGRDMGGGIQISAGGDIAFSSIGLSRYGLLCAAAYRFPKKPFMIGGNFRYANYKLDEGMAWKPVYTGGLELSWQFRRKTGKGS